jgi:acetylserotonin O-methyltransferase
MIDPSPILDLIYGFRRSKTMFAAVALGVFDRLRERPARLDEFAGDRGAMERLLDACVGLGLLEKHGAEYRNTPLADEYLCRSSPRTLSGYILYSNSALYPMWGNLEDALREGANRWEATFGFQAGGIFEHFFNSEELKRDFIAGMNGFGQISSPAVVAAFDLGRFRRFVDLGGATGHLALAAIERYPRMSAAVFDLPAVIEVAREYTRGKVDLIAGDFFVDPLPHADLYAVGRILHDWGESKVGALLDRIYAALPSGGGLLIAETLLDDDKCGPIDAQIQSLNMLICAEGRERTLPEYEALLRLAGFSEIAGCRTGAPLDAILALKS